MASIRSGIEEKWKIDRYLFKAKTASMVAHLDDAYPEDETYIRVLWLGNGFCSKENGEHRYNAI